jgi:hypothetical protein
VDEPRDDDVKIEPSYAVRQMAFAMRELYQGMIDVGFSPGEAIAIVTQCVQGALTQNVGSDEE